MVTEDLRRSRKLIVFAIVLISVTSLYTAQQSFVFAALCGLVTALAARGWHTVLPGKDQTHQVIVWRTPMWYYSIVFFIGVSLNMFFMFTADTTHDPNAAIPYRAFVCAWCAYMFWGIFRSRGKKSLPYSQDAEERALQMVSVRVLSQAGLAVKSVATGLEMFGTITNKDRDAAGNPFFDVKILPGVQTFATYVKAEERLASAWQVPRVSVSEVGVNIVRVTAHIENRSAIQGTLVWQPQEKTPILQYMTQLNMGASTTTGAPWLLDLRDKGFAVAGISRSGKSSFSNALIAHLAPHPDVRVAYIDLKNGAEASAWGHAVDHAIGTPNRAESVAAALDFILEANKDMSARYGRMIDAGVTNAITEGFLGASEPLKILIVDECSELFKTGTPEESRITARVTEALQTYNQQGLGAGYYLMMMTQRPKEYSLPLSIRENMSTKISFRLTGGAAAGIFGSNFNPPTHDLDPTNLVAKGSCVVMDASNEEDDGELFKKFQVCWLDDSTKKQVIASVPAKTSSWLDAPKNAIRETGKESNVAESNSITGDKTAGQTPIVMKKTADNVSFSQAPLKTAAHDQHAGRHVPDHDVPLDKPVTPAPVDPAAQTDRSTPISKPKAINWDI